MDVGEREKERVRMSEQRCQGWLRRVLVKSLERLAGPRGLEGRPEMREGWGWLSPEQSNAHDQEGSLAWQPLED